MEAAYKNIITDQHADMLLENQYLFLTKQFKLVSQSLDSNRKSSNPVETNITNDQPYYLLFLLHPQNPMLTKIYHSASIKSMKDIGNKTKPNTPIQSWFEQELSAIEKEKESFNEYFYYLNGKKLVSMVKVHDNMYERWSKFSQFKHSAHHFIVYLKVLDSVSETKPFDLFSAIPTGITAFSIKDVFLNGKQTKIAVTGSSWANPKMRSNFHSKYLVMYFVAMLQKRLNVRFGYCNIFEDNMKSSGVAKNCGMFVGDQKLTFIGMNVKRGDVGKETNVREIEDVQEYVSSMKDVYRNDGLLLQDLDSIYLSDSFAGCFVNMKENFTFQLWKCKYTEMKETGEKIPCFLVNNIVSNSTDENIEGPLPLNSSQYSKFVSSVKSVILSKLDSKDEVANIIFVTFNDQEFNKFIVDSNVSSNLSFAKLYYLFQDLKILDPKKINKSPLIKMINSSNNENHSKLLFTDVRDLTSKPMVSIHDEIKFTETSNTPNHSVGGGYVSKL